MGLCLKLDQDLTADVRRILAAQSKTVAKRLGSMDPTSAVHEARKGIKRMRALIRLVSHGLPPDVFVALNVTLRDIARGLSSARDVAALTLACDELAGAAAGSGQAAADVERARRLVGHVEASVAPAEAISAAARHITRFRRSARKIEITGDSDEVIVKGLAATYRRGRKALAKARASSRDSDYHELRKHVQAHWRQMLLITAAWPEEFSARAATSKALSANLGLDHDLAILAEHVGRAGRDQMPESAARRIATACEARQRTLRTAAAGDLDRLFAERTADFEARMALYLRAGRSATPSST